MDKPTLRKINLGFLLLFTLAFLGFTIYQYQIDGTAQAIVKHNSSLISDLQQPTYQLAQQLSNLPWDYDRPLTTDLTTNFQAIENRNRDLALQIEQVITTKLKEGINSPSLNNAEFVKQKLTNLMEQNLLLATMSSAHICLNNRAEEFRKQQTELDQNLDSYTNTADYAEGLGILVKIDNNYRALVQVIRDTNNCFAQPLRAESIYSDVQSTANKDLESITNYQQKFLQPLIKLYQSEDYGGVADFLANNTAQSQVKIIFPELWRNSKGPGTSYLSTQLRSIAVRIDSDNEIGSES